MTDNKTERKNPSSLESAIATVTGIALGATPTIVGIYNPESFVNGGIAGVLGGFAGGIAGGAVIDFASGIAGGIAGGSVIGAVGCIAGGIAGGAVIGAVGGVGEAVVGGGVGGTVGYLISVGAFGYDLPETGDVPLRRPLAQKRNSLLKKIALTGIITSASILGVNYLVGMYRATDVSAQHFQTEKDNGVIVFRQDETQHPYIENSQENWQKRENQIYKQTHPKNPVTENQKDN